MIRFALAMLMAVALLLPVALVPAHAQAAASAPFTAEQIEAATFTGQDLPEGRSALTAKVQMLLDRAGTSPGVADGVKGSMSTSAIKAFQRRTGLPQNGVLTGAVWAALQPYADRPITQSYTVTEADAADLVREIPTDYLQKANMIHLGYTSIAEKLAERFHMDEGFIAFLNPGVELRPGVTITVMAPGPRVRGTVTRIVIDKATRRVAGYDASGRMLVDYPATIGSDTTPSPSGKVTVTAVAINPEYTYNPKVNFQQGDNDRVLKIPPGPNGPVGTVWIALSKPTYGIHGTATPSRLFRNQSFGCVRLTNWDAEELAHLVKPGTTTVEFLEPGVSIADVTAAVTAPATQQAAAGPVTTSRRPPMRGATAIAAAARAAEAQAVGAQATGTTATGTTATAAQAQQAAQTAAPHAAIIPAAASSGTPGNTPGGTGAQTSGPAATDAAITAATAAQAAAMAGQPDAAMPPATSPAAGETLAATTAAPYHGNPADAVEALPAGVGSLSTDPLAAAIQAATPANVTVTPVIPASAGLGTRPLPRPVQVLR